MLSFCRCLTKLKEVKTKYEKAIKDGSETAELRKQIDELEKRKTKLDDQEEQMKKKEKVIWLISITKQLFHIFLF